MDLTNFGCTCGPSLFAIREHQICGSGLVGDAHGTSLLAVLFPLPARKFEPLTCEYSRMYVKRRFLSSHLLTCPLKNGASSQQLSWPAESAHPGMPCASYLWVKNLTI